MMRCLIIRDPGSAASVRSISLFERADDGRPKGELTRFIAAKGIQVLMHWCIGVLRYWRLEVLVYWCLEVLMS